MIPRVVKIAVGAVAVAVVACVDLAAPKNAPASISLLQVPELFVVRGDVMRDTSGNAATPSVIAYDGTGTPVTGFPPTFFVTDSNPVLTFNSAGVLAAGTRVGTGHVIGQIGNVQTPSATIYVTVPPTTLASTVVGSDTLRLVISADSATSMASYAMSVAVRGGAGTAADSGIGGAIVRYRMVSAPFASRTSALASYIADDANNPSVVDTTDATGLASRKLIVNSRFLADSLLLRGQKLDSVIVEARMKYRGVDLAGSPLRFVIKVKGGFGS